MSARKGGAGARARRAAAGATRSTDRPMTTQQLMMPDRARKGRCKQKIGMWGSLSTDYRTAATHDPAWSRTKSSAV